MTGDRMHPIWCADCARFRVTCKGVSAEPGWDGRNGGCGRAVAMIGQTTLEAFQ